MEGTDKSHSQVKSLAKIRTVSRGKNNAIHRRRQTIPYFNTVNGSLGEAIDCQVGAVDWMTLYMIMSTTSRGGASRFLTGESIFENTYIAVNSRGTITFSASCLGDIRKVDIDTGHEIIMQIKSYLVSTLSVEMTVYVNNTISAGMFSDEGFIMQLLTGFGIAFAGLDDTIKEYNLLVGEAIFVSTGYLAMMSVSCRMDIVSVSGMKNAFLGGEWIFLTQVSGLGTVWLQSMPVSKMSSSIELYIQADLDAKNGNKT